MKIQLENMQQYASDNKIPIIEKEGLEVVIDQIKKYNCKDVLEIGTAIGYSAINIHLANNCNVVSIEREEEMYLIAKENVQKAQLEDKIKLIQADALDFDETTLSKVDLLYVDAAKSQNIKYFEKYQTLLNEDGIAIFDNLLFYGYTRKNLEEIESKNLRAMIRKLQNFLEYINENNQYDFILIEQGDGIGIVRKKEKK